MVRGLVDTKSMVTKREEHGEEPGGPTLRLSRETPRPMGRGRGATGP